MALARGLATSGDLTFDWHQGHADPLNAVRVGKAMIYAVLLLPLLDQQARLDPAPAGNVTAPGVVVVRLAAPLSPALHLGAKRVLAISTRYDRTRAEADAAEVVGYPPPAQVLGVLLNAVFLDLVDQDAVRLERLNALLDKLPPEEREGMRPVRFLNVRPSQDLGRLAAKFEPQLPRAFRFMTRGLGTRQQRSSDVLAMLMFQPDYLAELIDMGERDAERMSWQLEAFFEDRKE